MRGDTAELLAGLFPLAFGSRLPHDPACAATELADAVGMEQSACSHQLRLLRNLGQVTGERRGCSIIYALYDNHVAGLLEQALYHVEYLRLGLRDTPASTPDTVAVAR
ncbi:ArsR family transcriptional regulator [Streptomyces coerulescens]|uniref:ArsR family transcriptional regulator n=1 Tax=Streptomyces coerulescens TaxID=29304 RepID=A0ABW0CVH2_STRCD